MKKACVIGGSGFLGSHVADHLSLAGYKVNIYDRTPSHWCQSDQTMIVGDILEIKKLEVGYCYAGPQSNRDTVTS